MLTGHASYESVRALCLRRLRDLGYRNIGICTLRINQHVAFQSDQSSRGFGGYE